ncbi:hypothetical protein ACOPJQ_02855 [Luteimonas dalianensis]|uniref:hypothetical protein n=1 Tax=Luteimonas dalianensis TaxID=1148196 RepID=UPI003BF289DD
MRTLLPALVLACAVSTAVHAQEPAAPADPVVLRVESGSVMVSQQGAEFVTVEADASLQPEDRVLVPEGSVASLDYGNGCVVSLVTGAYPVAASCPMASAPAAGEAAAAGATNTKMIVGVVAGVAAVAAIASGGGSDSSPPPVSR